MIPVFQTKFGGSDEPEEDQGDCMRACLASIFEIPLVEAPDFAGRIRGGGWFFQLQKWLGERNLAVLMLPSPAKDVPLGYAMAAVESETLKPGDGHMIVVSSGQLAHDPNPNAKRHPDEYDVKEYWAFTVRDSSKAVIAMRVSIKGPGDVTGKDAIGWLAFLDGEDVSNRCIEADDTEGYVLLIPMRDRAYLSSDANVAPPERRDGVVQLEKME